jgi:cell division protein FtsB
MKILLRHVVRAEFSGVTKKAVAEFLKVNGNINDFVLGMNSDNDKVLVEMFFPVRVKISNETPRFLKMNKDVQGIVVYGDNEFTDEIIMESDADYIVKGDRYKAALVQPELQESTREEIVEVVRRVFREECNKPTTEDDQAGAKIKELEAKIKGLDAEIKKLKAENEELKAKNKDIDAENKDLKEEIEELDTLRERMQGFLGVRRS